MDRRVERRSAILPIGNEIVEGRRIEHRAGEHVRAALTGLFQDGYRQWFSALFLL